MLEIDNISKSYRGIEAVSAVSISRWGRKAGLWEPYLGSEEEAFQRLRL
jgi:hypothetical protein